MIILGYHGPVVTSKLSEDRSNIKEYDEDDLTTVKSRSSKSSLLGRRSALKLLGLAAIPITAQSVVADTVKGYGQQGYGSGLYGGGDNEQEDSETNKSPKIDIYETEEDSPPNPHASIHVKWSVSDPVTNLREIRIDIFDVNDAELVESISVSASDSSNSGAETVTVHRGSGATYRVQLTVRNNTGQNSTEEQHVVAE